jgi:hypothetical protein
MAVPCRRDRDGRARGAIAGRSAPIVMCDTIFAGDEVAHYGLVSPAHYGFWKALTGRVAPANRLWETPDSHRGSFSPIGYDGGWERWTQP